jgi:hypothetical protein
MGRSIHGKYANAQVTDVVSLVENGGVSCCVDVGGEEMATAVGALVRERTATAVVPAADGNDWDNVADDADIADACVGDEGAVVREAAGAV